MNVIIPPHPTPPHPIHQRSTAYRCQRARTLHQHRSALCITRNMNVIIPPHLTPPHPTPSINVALRTDVSVHEHYINIAVRCASRVTWTLSSHPTPRNHDIRGKKCTTHAVPMGKAHKKVRVYRSTEPPTKVPTMMTGHSTSSSSSATHRAPFNPLINHHFPSKNWPCYRDIPLKKTCLSLNMFNHVYL